MNCLEIFDLFLVQILGEEEGTGVMDGGVAKVVEAVEQFCLFVGRMVEQSGHAMQHIGLVVEHPHLCLPA